jgi:DNA-binding SARP family transcriptional activator/tetratricopeptide (TPR) repeat protein
MSRPPVPGTAHTVADAVLEIRVLGPLEVVVAGRPLEVDTRKALAILALLAVERRPFARDELAALLWPESDDESARGALRRTLSVLRAALGDPWMRVDRSVVTLAPGAWVDLHVVEAATGSDDPTTLRAAVAAARGPFLAGFSLRDSAEFDDWRATRAVSVERSVTEVLNQLAAVSEATGDIATAIDAVGRRVALDPLDETAHRWLMALLARAGDRAAAIRQYRACVAVLERELGVPPLAETTALYEAIRDAPAEPMPPARPVAPSTPASTALAAPSTEAAAVAVLPLAGRDTELAVLLAARASASRDGRVMLVTGEAGIGKTRLVEALADHVEAGGGHALIARAYAAEAAIPYGPIAELLRSGLARSDSTERLGGLPDSLLGELGRLVALPVELERRAARTPAGDGSEPGARLRLLDAIAAGLAAMVGGPTPGMIAVEDVQWADEATRELLAWLARRLAGRPVALVLTWRPEDLDDLGTRFAGAVEGLPGVAVVRLRRLGRQAIADLVLAAAAQGLAHVDAQALMVESEGLPLFVVEALRGAGADSAGDRAARSVRALLRERLESVGETASQVLAAAAILGRSFHLEQVKTVSGRSDDETVVALEELVRRGLVRELDPGPDVAFDFAHGRLREATYESIGLARRRLLHRRAADLLCADPGHRSDPARLAGVAGHQLAAGRDLEAANAYREAGLLARTLYAHHEAAAHLATALALGHPDASGIQVALGEILTALGDYAGATASLEAAAAVADPDWLPVIEVRLGGVHLRRGDLATAASHLDAAIELLERPSSGDGAGLAGALVERAVVALRAGDLERANEVAERALTVAETMGDRAAEGAACRVLGLVARERSALDDARDWLRRSLRLAEADPDVGTAIAARNALALTEAAAGDRTAAIDLLEMALESCRTTGERHLEAAVENNLADQLHAVGRPDEAMEHLKRAVALFADVGGRPGELEPEIWKLVSW